MSAAVVLQLPIDDLPDDDPQARIRESVAAVFEAWKRATGRTRAVLLPTRAHLIAMRLRQGYSLDDLFAAVRGWQYDPWCAGDNPSGTCYCDLEFLLRVNMQSNNVERFADLYRVTRSLYEEVP